MCLFEPFSHQFMLKQITQALSLGFTRNCMPFPFLLKYNFKQIHKHKINIPLEQSTAQRSKKVSSQNLSLCSLKISTELKFDDSKSHQQFKLYDSIQQKCKQLKDLIQSNILNPLDPVIQEKLLMKQKALIKQIRRAYKLVNKQILIVDSEMQKRTTRNIFHIFDAFKYRPTSISNFLQKLIGIMERSNTKPNIHNFRGVLEFLIAFKYDKYIPLHSSKYRLIVQPILDLKRYCDYIARFNENKSWSDLIIVKKYIHNRLRKDLMAFARASNKNKNK